jgi:small ligand-binding sensory domain FIST
MLPDSTQVGLVSTATPFLTGRPNTLFHNDRIYDSGTVGIALPSAPAAYTVEPGLEPISSEMVVEA